MWRAIEKKLKTRLLQRLEKRAPERERAPADVDWSSIKRILVIRQHDQFGDFLLTTPAIHALRLRFPDAFISLIIRRYLYPVAFANPDVDEALVFEERAGRWTPGRFIRFVGALRRGYDLAVVFNTVSHSLTSDLLAVVSNAPLILGPAEPAFDHCARNPFYTLNAPTRSAPIHQIERNLDTVRYIGADTSSHAYRFALDEREEQAGRILAERLSEKPGKRIGAHFGTGDARKRYPISRLAEIARRQTAHPDRNILVLPAPGEDALLHELTGLMGTPVPVCSPLTLRQLAALIKHLDLVICNDTGVLHLAAAVGTPTVSFHATSDPKIWKPAGSRHTALYAASGRIGDIPVEDALLAIDRQLNATLSDPDGASGIMRFP
jgi:heptosyltransferase-2